MELRVGYKRTEVGVVPQEWDVLPFQDLLDFRNGINADKGAYGKGMPFINVLEIITKGHIKASDIPGRVSIAKNVAEAFSIRRGSMVFNRSSETPEEVGLAAVYLDTQPAVFGGFVIRGQFKNGAVDPIFSGYAFRAPAIRKQIVARGQGAIRANIGQGDLNKVVVPLPPLPEQRAIATALSDVDALLAKIDQLITKKRDLKQAAMQQLLTGQTRLPGFSGDWLSRPLRHFVLDFIVPMRDKPTRLDGKTPWCRIEDFEGTYLFESKSRQGVDDSSIQAMGLKVYPVGTLLVSCSADLGRCAIVGRPLVSNQTFIGLHFNSLIASNVFFYFYMTSMAARLNLISSGTTISYLSREQFESFVVNVPGEIAEQTAIATVLTDMDADLDALQARRDKTRALKQGMMQALLTGRIRLV